MRAPTRSVPRPTAAVALLGLACLVNLLDAANDALISNGPVTMLASLAAAWWVGATCAAPVAASACTAGAGLLMWANQLQNPGSYTPANDVAFFLVLLGAPALVGATWSARQRQLRELRRLSDELTVRRAAEVRAARLEEQNRVVARLQHGLVQSVGAIAVQSEGAAATGSPAERAQALARIEAAARGTLDELREHVGLLREPSAEDDASTVLVIATARTRPAFGLADLLAATAAVPVAVESVTGGTSRGSATANVLMALSLALPLAARRRHPVAAAAALWALAAVMSATLTPLPTTVSVTLPLLLSAYAVGAYVDRWTIRLAGTAVVVGGITLVEWASPPGSADPDGIAPTLLWLGLAVVAGVVAADRARRVGQVAAVIAALEESRDAELHLAVAEERHAIARDLHDSVAAAMTIVCLHATAAQTPSGDTDLASALITIAATARTGLAELRTSIDAFDEPEAAPDLDVRAVVAEARRAGMVVSLHLAEDELGPVLATMTARVVREALVNAARHAPGAAVHVRVARVGDDVEVEVVDTGPTSSGAGRQYAVGTGTGLRGLSERVGKDGGRLGFGPVPTGGFRVVAVLPLRVGAPA